jgi:uncharacterized paraquat-inducible protein A
MAKFFKIAGIISLIGNFLILFWALSAGIAQFVIPFMLFFLIAIMSIALGDLMQRAEILESLLGYAPPQETEKTPENRIMQITCPRCGKQHDLDDPKCPFCRYKE